ncbi:hypothetical protein BVK86_26685 [Pseudomonas reinekei]|uniref:Uncharacterized protein n=1 Tax=Pseudomonas reinekei TaxID=395598 RepID=A0A1Q9WKK1_PSERE|nr:hypothetical protein BVK86_26685 [Pseudomonas reinekei]
MRIELLELTAIEQQQRLSLSTFINHLKGLFAISLQLLQQQIELGEARQILRTPEGHFGLGQSLLQTILGITQALQGFDADLRAVGAHGALQGLHHMRQLHPSVG